MHSGSQLKGRKLLRRNQRRRRMTGLGHEHALMVAGRTSVLPSVAEVQ
jgi:hypothetical protein